jgi:predicted small lipoprotein YifL
VREELVKRNPIHRGSAEVRSSLSTAIAAVASSFLLVVSLAGCTVSGSPYVPPATEPPRTTAVPAPDDTTIDDVIEEAPPAPVEEAELDDTVTLDTGVRVSVTEISGITVEAETPGEIAGPAVAATIRFENASGKPLDLGGAMISLVDAAGNVATPTTSSPAAPTSGTLDDGGTAEGVYVFRMPQGTRDTITLTVDYAAGAPIVVFHGSVS